jgi:hypothetical protein
VVDRLDLSLLQKEIIKIRYVNLIRDTYNRALRISVIYYICHLIVTVGSLIVPALMSIQYMSSQGEIYWITWSLSLLVTTSNGLLIFFKIDKKYLYLHTNVEKLTTEGWQFSQLSGHYSGFYTPDKAPTHDNQFIFFCNRIEKIRMREVDDEYNKRQELQPDAKPSESQGQGQGQSRDTIIPITPMNPLQTKTSLKSILEEAEIDSPIVDGQARPLSVSPRKDDTMP